MRHLAFLTALVPVVAVALPPHLARLPEGAVSVGPAPQVDAAPGMAKQGERAGLWLPGGTRALAVDSVQRFAGGVETRVGRLEGGGHAVLTLGRDGGFARVVEGSTVWFLELRDGATYAVRAGAGGLALANDDDGPQYMPEHVRGASSAAVKRGAPSAAQAPKGFTTIDLLQIYDQAFLARYPGTLVNTRLAHLVALANQAFVDSGIRAVLRPVGVRMVTGALDGAISGNLDAMSSALQHDTYFGDLRLRALRGELGADLISFHRIHDMYTRGACGIAYFPSAILDTASTSVTVDGADLGSICDDLVFAHEIGHNLGARHNIEADGSPGSGHGFLRSGRFHTIMGTVATGHPDRGLRLGFFSNPRMACGGMPCGLFDIADVHGAITGNLGLVSGYRGAKSNAPAYAPAQSDPDIDGDGTKDRLDAFPFDATRSADRDQDGAADAQDAFPDNASETADFDRGGQGDVADLDDDNDGVPDASDALPHDPRDSSDADGDGIGDSQDAFANEPREDRDSDGDGTGDRADADDDGDGLVDLGSGATLAESELLVADDATDRIMRFRGSDLASLGTLVTLGPGQVTRRTGMASAPSGELWFVAGSSLMRLDRLRGELERMVDAFAEPLIASGFPMTPVLADADTVAFVELSTALLVTTPRWRRSVATFALGSSERLHLAAMPDGRVVGIDANSGNLVRWRLGASVGIDGTVMKNFVRELTTGSGATLLRRPIGGAVAADGSLYVIESTDGSVRRFDALGTFAPVVGFSAMPNASAVTVGPDGAVYVGLVGGGVRRLDPVTGADLGSVVGTGAAPAPVALSWVPRVVDTDLTARPAAPAPTGSDPSVTPTVGGPAPLPPPSPLAPCLSNCGGGGGGGATDLALFALLLALGARGRGRRACATPSLARPRLAAPTS